MDARPVTLEDWEAAKVLWQKFSSSPHAWKIQGSESTFRSYFTVSLVSPLMKVFGLFDGGDMVAFSICTESTSSNVNLEGVEVLTKETFVRAIFGLPQIPRQEGAKLDKLMDEWGKLRGHTARFGNCRTDFPVAGAARWGYKPRCLVMAKEIQH